LIKISDTKTKMMKSSKQYIAVVLKSLGSERKKMSASSSAKSFKNKDLNLSMRMKHAIINIID